jgi:ABC-type transport system involved in multi-copper enzyme maturation permease subunit
MSPPPVPSFLASTIAVGRLQLLRTLRGRKLRVAIIAAAVVILFPAAIALLKEDADTVDVVTKGIDWGFFRLLVFLLPILFTSGAIGEEVEGRTLHFLAMRPVSRAAIALAKYLVGTAFGVVVLWAALLLLHVIGYATEPSMMVEQIPETARAGGAATLLLMTYSGICLLWGALVPEAAGMLSIVWLGFVEVFVGLMPWVLRFASMAHFARLLGGLEPAGWPTFTPEVDLWVAGVVVACGWLLFTALGILTVQISELRFGRA